MLMVLLATNQTNHYLRISFKQSLHEEELQFAIVLLKFDSRLFYKERSINTIVGNSIKRARFCEMCQLKTIFPARETAFHGT